MKLLGLVAVPSALIFSVAYAQEASTPQPSPPVKACFNFDEVKMFKSIDADTIRIETNASQRFDLDLTGPKCSPLDQAGVLSIKTAPAFTLCTGPLGRGRVAFQSTTSQATISCTISKLALAAADPPKPK